jgi:hypothetical protein
MADRDAIVAACRQECGARRRRVAVPPARLALSLGAILAVVVALAV